MSTYNVGYLQCDNVNVYFEISNEIKRNLDFVYFFDVRFSLEHDGDECWLKGPRDFFCQGPQQTLAAPLILYHML